MMDTLKIKGNWYQMKGLIKKKYANLMDDDLMFVEGKEDELLDRIQKRTGKSRNEIVAFINTINK